MSLKIKKRGGDEVSFNPQKIYNRVKRASKGLNVNSDEIFIKVITSVPTKTFKFKFSLRSLLNVKVENNIDSINDLVYLE